MRTCPACGNLMLREPSTLVCIGCGRFAVVLDATDEARLAQRVLDWARRPKSYECHQDVVDYLPRRTGLRLPGEPTPKRRR